ncbi:MAG TPA: hypothetical protein VGB06_04740 [Solirubrobacterales bacterium]|jgi:hypothetical protein
MGELETHYRRLSRVKDQNPWKSGFGLLAVVLLGGVVGAALAGPGWTWEVKAAAALTLLAGAAWKGIAETESEGIQAIRDDFKRDILNSLILEPVESTASTGRDGGRTVLDRAVEEMMAELTTPTQEDEEGRPPASTSSA